MITFLLFIIGFVFLFVGADILVKGASAIAHKLGVSDLIIGLTLVAFGTSAPELIVNIFASIQGSTEIAVGNVLGSNLINIAVILGLSTLIFPLKVSSTTVVKDIPICIGSVLLFIILAYDTIFHSSASNILNRIDGGILLFFFTLFLIYMYWLARQQQGKINTHKPNSLNWTKSLALICFGLVGINIGAKWIVDGAIELALAIGISQSLISLTIVALGTSLPELATSAVAAYRKNTDIAVGNIVGSNIFNILFILGISALIAPVSFQVISLVDIGFSLLIPSLLLMFLLVSKEKYVLSRWSGFLFILLYCVYLGVILSRG